MNPYLRSIDIPLTFFFLIIRSKGIICHQYVSLKVCATHCSTKSNGLRQVKSPIVLNLVIIIVIENERRYEPRVQTKTRYQSKLIYIILFIYHFFLSSRVQLEYVLLTFIALKSIYERPSDEYPNLNDELCPLSKNIQYHRYTHFISKSSTITQPHFVLNYFSPN